MIDFSGWIRRNYLFSTVILVVLGVIVLFPYRRFAGDDAYITFQFARNFANGSGFAFNPLEPTYGSTAPLWVFLIAAISRSGLDVPSSAHLLNWIFLVTTIVLFYRLSSRYLDRGGAAWLATLLLIVDPWFVRWMMSGLENGLTLSLIIAIFISADRHRNSGEPDYITPAFAALGVICRPELLLLTALMVINLVVLERRRLLANLGLLGIAIVAVVGPWLYYATVTFGTPIPNTVISKISTDHFTAAVRVLQYFGSFWVFQAFGIIAIIAIKRLRRTAVERLRISWPRWFLPAMWAASLPAFYITGGAPVAGRYMMFALPTYLLIGVASWRLIWNYYPRVVVAAAAATLTLVIAIQYRYDWYVTRWPQGIDPNMVNAAEKLKDLSDGSHKVAASQIGAIGYYSGVPVLDLAGLVSPEVLASRKISSEALWDYVRNEHVAYLFVLDSELAGMAATDRARLELVDVFPVRREGASATELRLYKLYRTSW